MNGKMVYLSEIEDMEDGTMLRAFGKLSSLDLETSCIELDYQNVKISCNLKLIEQFSARIGTWYEFYGEKQGNVVICRILNRIESPDIKTLEAMYEIKKIYS